MCGFRFSVLRFYIPPLEFDCAIVHTLRLGLASRVSFGACKRGLE